jgi:hypothetical protein
MAPLDRYRPKTVDLGSTRLGNGLAAPQWPTLGLQKARRVFRELINPGNGYRRSTQAAGVHTGHLPNRGAHRSISGRHWSSARIGIAPSEAHARESKLIQTFQIQKLRGWIVAKMSDTTFRQLRITRAYNKLLCIPEGEAKVVSLVQIGNCEIRMLEASKTESTEGPLFLIELFDQDAQSAVDSCVCDDIEEGVTAFENLLSR